MQTIRDVEEKKLILAYFMARLKKMNSKAIRQQYSKWWRADLKHCEDEKAYINEITKFVKSKYDYKKGRKTNLSILKDQLLQYKQECADNIQKVMTEHHLWEQGFKFQNHTSRHHPLRLGRYMIIHYLPNGQKKVHTDSYEATMSYLTGFTSECERLGRS